MNIRLITLLSVLVLAAVSCDDSEMASAWDDPRYVHLVAPMEDVTGSTAQELSFQTGQQMKVWERNGNSVALSADSDSTFISHDWIPKAVPAYAAFPARENVSCTSDGVFCLAVDSVQKVMTPGTVENFVAVGKVSGHQRTSYRVGQMRNVTGFLALNLGYPLVTSIKVESVAGEPMAGKITVDHARLEGGENRFYEVADSASASVTLVPSVADTTLSVGTYHLALLPGTYSNGFRITVNYQSGTPVEMTCFGEGVTVERSGVSSPGAGYADDDLPEEVRIDLDFAAGWPSRKNVFRWRSRLRQLLPEIHILSNTSISMRVLTGHGHSSSLSKAMPRPISIPLISSRVQGTRGSPFLLFPEDISVPSDMRLRTV